jgi:2'-5' RNA ligase
METKIETHRRKTGRYFIAIIPPEPLYREVQELKEYFRDRYHGHAALRSPPHITLHMPFEWKREKESMLCDALESFFNNIGTFELKLLNFSCFAPKTIFIDVELCPELETVQKELERFCRGNLNLFQARYRDLPFHPHLTIAFRDMKKETFAEAWGEFGKKKFIRKFNVSRVALLKDNETLWKPVCYFSLHLNL